MKKMTLWWMALGLFLVLGLTAPPMAQARPVVKVDVLFMNHGPMQPVIKSLKEILARHSLAASASWHDFETASGQDFMRRKGLAGHIPLLVFINDSSTWQVQGRKVTFVGFPNGYGPYQFQGQWSLADLDRLLGTLASPSGAKAGKP
ncbi:hypothetical protein [Desulfoferula mesophila]|uniref:Uncharacterized protein n=1 Tax=Desulfoferula mesophila TaxID=3058419 RepID=A0AAU9EH65_9BACT|nr:hypothetical protein FAK_24010 [Desulfoferula mesophilus]